tara:strand:- start:1863 stop:3515 length:1653 start_codon:yes stop_codon:yes gene_type:complete
MNLKGINNDGEIELRTIFRFLLRNKYNIFIFSFLGLVLGIFSYVRTPKVWKGEFQIVLNVISSNNYASSILNKINTGAFNQQDNLSTQVEVLSSPSVLLEVFEFVKNKKIIKNVSNRNLSFIDWRENLDIELVPRTSVLNLSYKDKDRNLILPVLKKISDKYISYSYTEKKKDLEDDVNFYEKQIDLFKSKSVESYKEAKSFGMEHDLLFELNKSDDNIIDKQAVEVQRVNSANRVRDLNEILKQIKQTNVDSDRILYFQDILNGEITINPLLVQRFNSIDNQLAQLREIFLEDDKYILRLKNERKKLKKTIKNDLIESINTLIISYKSNVISNQRPKEILLEFAELTNQATRDAQTLSFLENQLRILSLDLSKIGNPWDLITKPTLLPNSVAPRKRNYYPLGLIIGTFIGIVFSYVIEKKKNIIFDSEELQNLFTYPILDELTNDKNTDIVKTIKFISANKEINEIDNIGILFDDLIDDNLISSLKKCFKSSFNNEKISFASDIRDIEKDTTQIIIIQACLTKKNQLLKLVQKLISNQISILGFIVISR